MVRLNRKMAEDLAIVLLVTEKTDFKLAPEIKKLILEALRHGGYNQIRGACKTPEGFGFMGVCCEIFRLHHPETGVYWEYSHFDKNNGDIYCLQRRDGGSAVRLVTSWMDIPSFNYLLLTRGGKRGIPILNLCDIKPACSESHWAELSFKELADLIEAQL